MPKAEKSYRSQKYRKEWEKESWAMGWLTVGKGEKAHCKVGDKELVAGKSELIGHTKTSSHIRLAKQVQSNHLMPSYVEVNHQPVKYVSKHFFFACVVFISLYYYDL